MEKKCGCKPDMYPKYYHYSSTKMCYEKPMKKCDEYYHDDDDCGCKPKPDKCSCEHMMKKMKEMKCAMDEMHMKMMKMMDMSMREMMDCMHCCDEDMED